MIYIKQRILSLDVMRGISLMGILFMNALGVHYFTVFDEPFHYYKDSWSQFLYQLNLVFIQNAFYPIFAFLFGVGLAIMYTNMVNKGMKPGIVLYRRIIAMLAFGLIHGYFLYNGDILHTYATLGLVVIPFLFIHRRYALMISIGLLLLNFLLYVSSLFNEQSTKLIPFNRNPHTTEILQSGHILEIIKWNMNEFNQVNTMLSVGNFFAGILTVFPSIMLGTWAYRFELFDKMRRHLKVISVISVMALAIGIFIKMQSFDVIGSAIAPQIVFVGGTFMAIGYFCLVTLLCQLPKSAKALNPMVAVGKLGFTVYITQSVILFFVFYILRLYGMMTISQVYLLIIGVVVLQIVACNIYMKFYKMGPLEWLWRKITYLK
ncbi:hypothetical protein BUZ56_10925 [Staphylococcus hyicus]|nr:hypothetical protein BUZ56_10925 [Staphylococcus hyicus]